LDTGLEKINIYLLPAFAGGCRVCSGGTNPAAIMTDMMLKRLGLGSEKSSAGLDVFFIFTLSLIIFYKYAILSAIDLFFRRLI
jgi:hypothetical protein